MVIGNITGLVWGDAGATRGSSTTVEDSVGAGALVVVVVGGTSVELLLVARVITDRMRIHWMEFKS